LINFMDGGAKNVGWHLGIGKAKLRGSVVRSIE
jgi:hypothetical protein